MIGKTLLTLAALLLVALALAWRGWPTSLGVSSVGTPAPSSGGVKDVAVLPRNQLARLNAIVDKGRYRVLTERPLFRPDRLPPPPPQEQAPDSPAPPGPTIELTAMDLSAVMITPGVVSAWIKSPDEKRIRRLRVGDEFKGWRIQSIEPDRVLMQRQGQTDALVLRDYANGTVGAGSRPPAAVRSPHQPTPTRAPVLISPDDILQPGQLSK